MNDEFEDNHLESEDFEQVLRPKGFDDFKGQEQIVDNLKVFIKPLLLIISIFFILKYIRNIKI